MNDPKTPAHRNTQARPARQQPLSIVDAGRRPAGEQRGSDPYNTSGSFDRKKNWARVGKR